MYTKLSVRPQMNISPQLVITGKLLQVPGYDLEQFINRELADNPALELVNKPDFMKTAMPPAMSEWRSNSLSIDAAMARSDHLSSYEGIIEHIAQRQSPLEKLAEQVSLMANKSDREIAIYLLHRLDQRGFLVTSIEQLASELSVCRDAIMGAIQILHQLEPPGIGARDIRECFLIQCTHLEAEKVDCQQVRRILTLAWSEFLNQQWDRVARKIQEPKKVVEDACEFMRLNFYAHPLAILETSNETDTTLSYADLIIRRDSHVNPPAYSLQVPGAEEFELKVSMSFQTLLGSESQDAHELSLQEKTWIKIHVDRAWMVISALSQRWETLRRIGEYLIQYQKDFLERGPLYLKPLTRAVVAEELHVHESTISRAVRDKIVQLPNGHLISLSDLFDPSLVAKEAIRLLLKDNYKGLCDRQIAENLQAKGIHLSRRTVTKYRREIHIDSSRQQSVAI